MTVELSDADLTLLHEACRFLASRYARDADYEQHPVVKKTMLDGAVEMDRLGDRLLSLLRS